MNDIGKLVRYKAWANELLYDGVAKLPEAALTQPDPIIFGNLLRTLHHTYAMDYRVARASARRAARTDVAQSRFLPDVSAKSAMRSARSMHGLSNTPMDSTTMRAAKR